MLCEEAIKAKSTRINPAHIKNTKDLSKKIQNLYPEDNCYLNNFRTFLEENGTPIPKDMDGIYKEIIDFQYIRNAIIHSDSFINMHGHQISLTYSKKLAHKIKPCAVTSCPTGKISQKINHDSYSLIFDDINVYAYVDDGKLQLTEAFIDYAHTLFIKYITAYEISYNA